MANNSLLPKTDLQYNDPDDYIGQTMSVALLDILPGKQYNGWTGTEILEVEAPGSAVFIFTDSRFHGR